MAFAIVRFLPAICAVIFFCTGTANAITLAELPTKEELPKFRDAILNGVMPVEPGQIFLEIRSLERERDSLKLMRESSIVARAQQEFGSSTKQRLESNIETVNRIEKCDAPDAKPLSDSAIRFLSGALSGLDEDLLRRYANDVGVRLDPLAPSGTFPEPSDKRCKAAFEHYRKLVDSSAPAARKQFEQVKRVEAEKLANVEAVSAIYSQRIEDLKKLLDKARAEKVAAQQSDRAQLLANNLWQLSLALGAIALLFIVCIRAFSESIQSEFVGSGQVIQFVTVLILLIIIMALGLAGIIAENTLGTLLGGLAGYVLSQGVGRAAEHRMKREQLAPGG